MKKQMSSSLGGRYRVFGFLLGGLVFQMGFGGVALAAFCDPLVNAVTAKCILYVVSDEGVQIRKKTLEEVNTYLKNIPSEGSALAKVLQRAANNHCSEKAGGSKLSSDYDALCIGVRNGLAGQCGDILAPGAEPQTPKLSRRIWEKIKKPRSASGALYYPEDIIKEKSHAISLSSCYCIIGHPPDKKLFQSQAGSFLQSCQEALNPNKSKASVSPDCPREQGVSVPVVKDLGRAVQKAVEKTEERKVYSSQDNYAMMQAALAELKKHHCEDAEGLYRKVGQTEVIDQIRERGLANPLKIGSEVTFDSMGEQKTAPVSCHDMSDVVRRIQKEDPLLSGAVEAEILKVIESDPSRINEIVNSDLKSSGDLEEAKKKALFGILSHMHDVLQSLAAQREANKGKNQESVMSDEHFLKLFGSLLFPNVELTLDKNIIQQQHANKIALARALIENRGGFESRGLQVLKKQASENRIGIPTKESPPSSPEAQHRGKNFLEMKKDTDLSKATGSYEVKLSDGRSLPRKPLEFVIGPEVDDGTVYATVA